VKRDITEKFGLEKPVENIGLFAILFCFSRLFDYITTDIAISLGFSENTNNWLFYIIDNWYLFWFIQISLLSIIFYLFYMFYKYSTKIRSLNLKFISLLFIWGFFIISWTAPIHNTIHLILYNNFNLITTIPFMNILNFILIGLVFVSLSIDLLS
jgi:hypothetical protein